jgi:hypothetical protein
MERHILDTQKGGHGGVNDQSVHQRANVAKYVFPPGKGAARIDMHPDAWTKFSNTPMVFFVIEGCIKADAILTAGYPVFSAPSVTLWDVPELKPVIERYAKNRVVYIVADADWYGNDQVLTQALLCRTRVLSLGAAEAHVCAPSLDFFKETGEKGVDDFLAAGRKVEDLEVLEREAPYGLAEWIAENRLAGRLDKISSMARACSGISLHAGTDGRYKGTISALGKAVGMNKRTAARAVGYLRDYGAVAVEGSLETQPAYTDRSGTTYGMEWQDPPTLTLVPELRATERWRRLGG